MDTTTTDVSVPARNIAHRLAEALHALPFEESEVAFRKLQHGSRVELDGDTATICFADGSPFISLPVTDLLRPPAEVRYHVLLRWVYVVPGLARAYADPTLEPEQREVHAAVFRALHQYLGVGVGEHLGYLFTGIWSVLIGVGVIQGTCRDPLKQVHRK